MEAYMSQTENKLNIDQLLGNISKNDLIGTNGISSNGLATLVENIIHEIMNIMSPFVKTNIKFFFIPPLMLPQVTYF